MDFTFNGKKIEFNVEKKVDPWKAYTKAYFDMYKAVKGEEPELTPMDWRQLRNIFKVCPVEDFVRVMKFIVISKKNSGTHRIAWELKTTIESPTPAKIYKHLLLFRTDSKKITANAWDGYNIGGKK